MAPRNGKLALVIHCSALKWPVVLAVEEYSSLYLNLLPGVRTLAVDGEDTFDKPLGAVREIIKRTSIDEKRDNDLISIEILTSKCAFCHILIQRIFSVIAAKVPRTSTSKTGYAYLPSP